MDAILNRSDKIKMQVRRDKDGEIQVSFDPERFSGAGQVEISEFSDGAAFTEQTVEPLSVSIIISR